MKWALVNEDNICINIIEYDGVSAYAPGGQRLARVDDWIEIGDKADKAAPLPYQPTLEFRRNIAKLKAEEMGAARSQGHVAYENGQFPGDNESLSFLQSMVNAENYRLGTSPLDDSFFPARMRGGEMVDSITIAKKIYMASAKRRKEIEENLFHALEIIDASEEPESIVTNQEI